MFKFNAIKNMRAIPDVVSNRLAKLSFLCALLVVVLHVGIGPKWIGKVLALKTIAVPTFFVMAGYLFAGRMDEQGWYFRQVKSRMKSLFVPYVFWNFAFWSFVVGLTYALGVAGVQYGGMKVLECRMWRAWDILGVYPLGLPALGFLWFVRCLLAIVLVSPVFKVFAKKWVGILLVISFIVMWWFEAVHPEPEHGWVGVWLLKGWIRSVVYFGLGVWLRFNGGENLRVPRLLAFFVLAIAWLVLSCGNDLVRSLTVPVAMWGLWYSLSIAAWPKALTSCSFPIYVLHIFGGTLAAALIGVVGLKSWAADSVLAWLVKWGIMTVGPIAVCWTLRKYFPKFCVIAFGGR